MSGSAPPDEDDPFEAQREAVENPMKRLFLAYGRPYLPQVSVGVGIAIDAIFYEDARFGDQVPLVVVPDAWLPVGRTEQFWFTVAVIGGAFVLGAGFHWVRNWGFNAFAQHVQHDVRTDTYDQMQRLNMGFFADKQTGEMMSILSNDVNRLERFLNDGMNSLFRLSVMVVGIGGLLVWINPQLALVALFPVPIIAGFTYLFIKIIQPKYAAVRSSVGQLNSRLENNLGGIQVIKSSNTEPYESDRVDDVSMEYFDANWDAIRTRITFFPALRRSHLRRRRTVGVPRNRPGPVHR
jgi:ATP-binding cassette subfamily B protein